MIAPAMASMARAAAYTWDPAKTGTATSGGTGTWNLDTTNKVWFLSGSGDVAWPNGATDTATFTGTAGTVTIADTAVKTSALTFNSAGYTLDLGGTTQTLTAFGQSYASGTTTLTNGSIVLNAIADTVLGNGTTAGSTDTIDLSGLSAFTFNSAKNLILRPATTTGASNAVLLGSATSNTITAGLFQVGAASGGSQGTVLNSTFRMGVANAVTTDSMIVGGFNGSGLVNFQTAVTGGLLTLRGPAGGSARAASVIVGQTSSGVRDGNGVLDLTGGSLDARIATLVIGQHIAAANNTPAASSVTLPAGTLDATEIVLGDKTNTGTPTLNSNFNQSGGTVTAGTLTLARGVSGATPTFNSNYNLSGGTLRAGLVRTSTTPGTTANASSARKINWTGGTISNFDASTDLSIDGVTGGTIQVIASTAGTKAFDVDANRKITLGANSSLTGAGVTVNKSGLGSLYLNSTAPVTTSFNVTGGTLGGGATVSGGITTAAGTTIAPGNSIGTLGAGSATVGGTLAIEYSDAGGTTADGSIDKLVVAGALDITNAAVSFSDFAPTSALNDTAYVFASYGSLVGSAFASVSGLPSGYGIQYAYDNGAGPNTIALVAVPEPAALAVLALTSLSLVRRRRHA